MSLLHLYLFYLKYLKPCTWGFNPSSRVRRDSQEERLFKMDIKGKLEFLGEEERTSWQRDQVMQRLRSRKMEKTGYKTGTSGGWLCPGPDCAACCGMPHPRDNASSRKVLSRERLARNGFSKLILEAQGGRRRPARCCRSCPGEGRGVCFKQTGWMWRMSGK